MRLMHIWPFIHSKEYPLVPRTTARQCAAPPSPDSCLSRSEYTVTQKPSPGYTCSDISGTWCKTKRLNLCIIIFWLYASFIYTNVNLQLHFLWNFTFLKCRSLSTEKMSALNFPNYFILLIKLNLIQVIIRFYIFQYFLIAFVLSCRLCYLELLLVIKQCLIKSQIKKVGM